MITQTRVAAHKSTPAAFFMAVKAAAYFDVTVLEFISALEIALDPRLRTIKSLRFSDLLISEDAVTGNGVTAPFVTPTPIEVINARDFILRAVDGRTR